MYSRNGREYWLINYFYFWQRKLLFAIGHPCIFKWCKVKTISGLPLMKLTLGGTQEFQTRTFGKSEWRSNTSNVALIANSPFFSPSIPTYPHCCPPSTLPILEETVQPQAPLIIEASERSRVPNNPNQKKGSRHPQPYPLRLWL